MFCNPTLLLGLRALQPNTLFRGLRFCNPTLLLGIRVLQPSTLFRGCEVLQPNTPFRGLRFCNPTLRVLQPNTPSRDLRFCNPTLLLGLYGFATQHSFQGLGVLPARLCPRWGSRQGACKYIILSYEKSCYDARIASPICIVQ